MAEMRDPIDTDPDKYSVVFENDRVRVLEYRDSPGARTRPHEHPDSVMLTLSGFERRLTIDGRVRDVTLERGQVRWLDAQSHTGENIGATDTHVVFVELKEPIDMSYEPEWRRSGLMAALSAARPLDLGAVCRRSGSYTVTRCRLPSTDSLRADSCITG